MTDPQTSNDFMEQQLDERARAVEREFKADTLYMSGPIHFGLDDLIRGSVEFRRQADSADKLVVFITTSGGYIEVAQRIVETFRHHYKRVEFVVPNQAFSAGTVIALSGDAIHMDYYSRLGPIDPQVDTSSGRRVSALGYLRQYERLMKRACDKKNPITVAELTLLRDAFDQAELYQFEQARNLTITLLKRWLVNYKFRLWNKTEARGKRVTSAMKTRRAGKIATILNDTDRWHSHGYGISMTELIKDVGIRIDDLSANKPAYECVGKYATLTSDYMMRVGTEGVVHVVGRWLGYS